jgi:hypothetical protein
VVYPGCSIPLVIMPPSPQAVSVLGEMLGHFRSRSATVRSTLRRRLDRSLNVAGWRLDFESATASVAVRLRDAILEQMRKLP